MVRWISRVKVQVQISTDTLYERLCISHLDTIMHQNCLCWAGHMHRSTSWICQCQLLQVEGSKLKGKPRKLWNEMIKKDLCAWTLTMNKTYGWRKRCMACEAPRCQQHPGKGRMDIKCTLMMMMMMMMMTISKLKIGNKND